MAAFGAHGRLFSEPEPAFVTGQQRTTLRERPTAHQGKRCQEDQTEVVGERGARLAREIEGRERVADVQAFLNARRPLRCLSRHSSIRHPLATLPDPIAGIVSRRYGQMKLGKVGSSYHRARLCQSVSWT